MQEASCEGASASGPSGHNLLWGRDGDSRTLGARFRLTASSLVHWLRRPPIIVDAGRAFEPTSSDELLERAWIDARSRNSRLTDGPCWHVSGVHRNGHGGASIHVVGTTYRMGVCRGAVATGFVGLGMKALAHWNGKFLVGRRSDECLGYPGCWEFAPSGAVEPGEDPARGIVRELLEECALEVTRPPRALAIAFDSITGNWEIVYDLQIRQPPDAPPNWEYTDLRLVDLARMPTPYSPITEKLLAIAHRAGVAAPQGTDHRRSRA